MAFFKACVGVCSRKGELVPFGQISKGVQKNICSPELFIGFLVHMHILVPDFPVTVNVKLAEFFPQAARLFCCFVGTCTLLLLDCFVNSKVLAY